MAKKKNFGPYVREKRIKLGFGQRELAEKIGVALYLNDIEKEKEQLQNKLLSINFLQF